MASFKDDKTDSKMAPRGGFFLFVPVPSDATTEQRAATAQDLWEWMTQSLLERAVEEAKPEGG